MNATQVDQDGNAAAVSPQSVAFLHPDIDQIRHQIRGILDSYSHDWDVLAELAQNSVDAITRRAPTRGHIKVSVNAQTKTIEFSDNGTGIDPADLQRLLRPFGTDKRPASHLHCLHLSRGIEFRPLENVISNDSGSPVRL